MALSFYVATTSQGKLLDFQTAAKSHSIEINPLPDLSDILAPEEDGVTFADNATLKAVYYSHLLLASSSSPMTPALKWTPSPALPAFAPLVLPPTPAWSTRPMPMTTPTSGTTSSCCSASRQCPKPNAQPVIAACWLPLVMARRSNPPKARSRDVILEAPRGTGGFGYDPLFYLPDFDCTMAEINLETKHSLSHRGKAFQNLLAKLRA